MTASNAAAALGIKPYESFRGDVRTETIHQIISGSFKGNVATRHGTMYEDEVRLKFSQIIGERIEEFGLLVHQELDWLAASPDGICVRSGFMVEIKCPYRRQIHPGEIPHHYFPQIQVQLEVCDLPACYFVQYQPGWLSKKNDVLDITLVERDKSWFESHRGELLSFYEDLMAARELYVPPPPPQCLIVDSLYDSLNPQVSRPLFLLDE
jgi:putative phage-type endonuclease